MRKWQCFVFQLALLKAGEIAAQTDSTRSIGLGTFVVQGWDKRTELEPTASRTAPDSTLQAGFERSSLRSPLLWVPGVQMDERGHGGSTRLSIRGSLLRAPYGVRGVKVYHGPFPMTLADGSTPLELLDPLLCDEVVVDRQVGDPRYGAAPAGLLRTDLAERKPERNGMDLEALGGPFGYYRLAARGGASGEQGQVEVGVLHQRNDGFRDQEYTARDQFFLNTTWKSRRSSGRAFITWQRTNWALPGGLDSLTAAERPTTARTYAQLIDAHVEKQQVFGGIAAENQVFRSVQLNSVVHAQRIDKKNPYGNTPLASGDKEERIVGIGGRAWLEGRHRIGQLPLRWHGGVEALAERDRLDEYAFQNAVRDTLRISGDTRVGNLNAFAGVEVLPGPRTRLSAAAGTERTSYDHQDLQTTTTHRRAIGPGWLPMVAWEQQWVGAVHTVLRYAGSVSRPTIWELLGSSGMLNTELGPETVRELQVGLFTRADSVSTGFSLSIYRRWVEGLIMARHGPVEGEIRYENAGQALLDGAEAEAFGTGRLNDRWTMYIAWFLTFQHHRLAATDTTPQLALTGVPEWQLGMRVRATWSEKVQLEWGIRLVDEVPACLYCADRIPAYALAHLRAGWLPRPATELFLHVENLFNARYTSFVQIDDPGRRYYNPAPPVGVYVGLRWSWARPPARV